MHSRRRSARFGLAATLAVAAGPVALAQTEAPDLAPPPALPQLQLPRPELPKLPGSWGEMRKGPPYAVIIPGLPQLPPDSPGAPEPIYRPYSLPAHAWPVEPAARTIVDPVVASTHIGFFNPRARKVSFRLSIGAASQTITLAPNEVRTVSCAPCQAGMSASIRTAGETARFDLSAGQIYAVGVDAGKWVLARF